MATAICELEHGTITHDGYDDVQDLLDEYNSEHGESLELSDLQFTIESSVSAANDEEVNVDELEEVIALVDAAEGDDYKEAVLTFLLNERGYTFSQIDHDALNDPILFNGDLEDAARDYADQCLESVPDWAERFIDYQAFGEQLESDGDFDSFRVGYSDWVCTNAGSF